MIILQAIFILILVGCVLAGTVLVAVSIDALREQGRRH